MPVLRNSLCALIVATALSACGVLRTAQDIARIDEMSEQEVVAYADRAGSQLALIAQAAIEEGDLKPEQVLLVVDVLDGLAEGTITPGVLKIEAEGYGKLAIALALQDLDQTVGAIVSEKDRVVLRAVSAALRDVAE